MKTRSGFTLIELLIVIAIIGVLVGFISSAVLRITRTSAEKRAANNAKVLQAAIFEYWHDNGKWPVGTDKPSKVSKTYSGLDSSTGGEAETMKYVGTYNLTYYADNYKVVKNLIDATLPDGTHKTYLDLRGFAVPTKITSTFPVDDTVDAQQALDGTAVDSDGNKVSLGKNNLTLVWRSAKTNRAKPFKIFIDYDNNLVSVTCE